MMGLGTYVLAFYSRIVSRGLSAERRTHRFGTIARVLVSSSRSSELAGGGKTPSPPPKVIASHENVFLARLCTR